MLEKLKFIETRYEELSHVIADPEVIARQEEWQGLVKEHASLEEIVTRYRELKSTQQEKEDTQGMLEETRDIEFKQMIELELEELGSREGELLQEIRLLLLPKDPMDEKNVVMEIRGGAGGDEAALFGAVLYRMYSRYAERQGWKLDIMSSSFTELGGVKELIFTLEGKGAFSRLKYESGVHRVQRVPTTESGGRIHTSTVTVAVLPEAEDVDIEINPNDLRIDVFRSSGHGGQSVNTTDSAVRITHLLTGMVVSCQDEKSQLKNKEKALKVLKSRLLDMAIQEKESEYAQNRKTQVGTGDRSERVRTYNYPQGRVTDHRIGLTIHQLEDFLDGNLDEMVKALAQAEQAKKLQLQFA
ncbi:MAG: peptide chain release factor 1 [Clostridia bacterium]|nr:peptide chain release factor 1 [Clostridia bacterium]MDD4679631.1 peptide chain release factor 1 [Clostridia bacterium]